MGHANRNSLFLSLFILSIGTIGGMAITWKVAGVQVSHDYLRFGIVVQTIVFLVQLFIFPKARKELRFQLLYLASCGLTLVWFMMALILPLFWTESVGLKVKWILAGMTIFTGISNYRYGLNSIHRKWKECGAAEFERRFAPAKNVVDWDKVVRKMKVELVIYVPIVPQSWNPWCGVGLVVSSFLGLNLRNVFPVFSIFAFGIPSAVAAAMLLQLSGCYIAQASKVKAIEKERRIKIRSTG